MAHDEYYHADYGEDASIDPEDDGVSDQIKVLCHGCGARYQVRAGKVRGRRFRATCKKCGGIIVAHCSNAFTVLPDRGSRPPARRSSRPLELGRDDLYQEEEGWYVVIAGKPHGPLTGAQVRQSFEGDRISGRTYLWRAGDPEWRRLGEVPEFMDLVAEGEHTAYYQGVAQPDLMTGKTKAAGPAGLRKAVGADSPAAFDESVGEQQQTAFFQGQGEDEGEATQFHVRQQQPEQWEPPPPQPEQWEPPPPQPEPWEQVPVIPPRPAMLPAPSGARRVEPRTSAPMLPAVPAPDYTRPLSDHERVQAIGAGPPQLLPSLAPDLPPPPPPASSFSQSLKPVGPPVGPALLAPADEPFWTTGKIAAAAAIGGGLAVAMAVVVVVSLVRPKPRPVELKPAVAMGGKVQKGTPRKAPEISIKVKPAEVTPKKAPPAEEAKKPVETPSPKPAVTGPVVKTHKTKTKPRRVTLRKKPAQRRASKKKKVDSEVDALLAGASKDASKSTKTKASGGVDPDALLMAGTGSSPKPKKKKSAGGDGLDPDALLAVAQKPKKPKKPKGLTREQIVAAASRVNGRVRACAGKYDTSGRAKVRFVVRPDGTFDAQVVGQFAGSPTGFCVLAAVNQVRFPSFSGSAIKFNYPFTLK